MQIRSQRGDVGRLVHRGSLDRVTAKVFLLSPANVTVTAEEKLRLAEGGFFNQS